MTNDGPKCLVDSLIEEKASSLEEGKEVIFTDERIKSTIIETVFVGKTVSQHSCAGQINLGCLFNHTF